MNLDQLLAGWHRLPHEERQKLAERLRPKMLDLVAGMGVREQETVRPALELIVAACEAELDAAEPTPLPNRAHRRARR